MSATTNLTVTPPPASGGAPPPVAGLELPTPHGFVRDVLERTWTIRAPRSAVWAWLCDPATFTESQVPPWRVEFVDPATGRPAGFTPGVLTTHHGPFLHFCGVIGEVDEGHYRDLQYTYGAYAFTLRAFRPVRLEFWLDDAPRGATLLRLRVTTDVRRGLVGLWRGGNRLFWSRFGAWCRKGVAARA